MKTRNIFSESTDTDPIDGAQSSYIKEDGKGHGRGLRWVLIRSIQCVSLPCCECSLP